ncbi:acetyl-CoA acetyltransferase family protein [Paraburkholderia sp. UCT70]
MTDAVIVSTARTGLAKSWRGGFNMTHGATLGGHVTQAAVERAKLDPARVEDVIMGCANPEGATGGNIARQIALRAGLPVSVPGMTVNRFCSSGLQTIALASQRVIAGEGDVYVAGGVESISCVQNEMNGHMMTDGWLTEHKPEIYWSMLQTAENVAKRYSISKERQDEYGVRSQQRAAAALEAGKFKDEIVPLTVLAGVADKASGRLYTKEVTVSSDEGIRADTTLEGVSKIRTAQPGGVITAGNASQFSDGASACVVMNATLAEREGLQPLGIFRGFAVAGCEPDEMGIGPVFAVPKLLKKARPQGRGHRPVGTERSVRGAGALLRRPARHCARPPERERRRDRGGPSVRRVGSAARRPCADRRQAARREVRRRDDVHRRRAGRGGFVRSGLSGRGPASLRARVRRRQAQRPLIGESRRTGHATRELAAQNVRNLSRLRGAG